LFSGLEQSDAIVEYLLSLKDGIKFLQTRHYDGLYPIHRAACSGKVAMLKKFIALGEDINKASSAKATALMLAAQEGTR
jgi:ankyrin repeat protein